MIDGVSTLEPQRSVTVTVKSLKAVIAVEPLPIVARALKAYVPTFVELEVVIVITFVPEILNILSAIVAGLALYTRV